MDHAQRKLVLPAFFLGLLFFALAGVWLAGDWPDNYGNSLRMPASGNLHSLSQADYPEQIEETERNGRLLAVRRRASASSISPEIVHAFQFVADAPHVVKNVSGPPSLTGGTRLMFPLLVPGGSASAGLVAFTPPEYGDALDSRGRPFRWSVPENILASYSVPRPSPFPMPEPKPISRELARALARLAPARKASDYRALVEGFAKRYGLNTDLVMAIIHSESNFVPYLVSSKSAMGLMQLLPSTASGEVHRFLYGTSGRVNFEQLSVPEINIRYGTAYLHILENRYFAGVRDHLVREACVIAAYNMGPNGFLRLYGATPEQAVTRINSMGQDEFLEDLQRRLPMRETRFYVEKVRRMKEHYSSAR